VFLCEASIDIIQAHTRNQPSCFSVCLSCVVVAICRHRLCFETWLHNTLYWECLLLLVLFLMWYDSVLYIYIYIYIYIYLFIYYIYNSYVVIFWWYVNSFYTLLCWYYLVATFMFYIHTHHIDLICWCLNSFITYLFYSCFYLYNWWWWC